MTTLLDVRHVSKSFEQTDVLKEISFTVDRGEFIAIMGQSGSGKSTLLYTISGMDRPTTGNVLFDRKEIAKLTDEEMSNVRLHQMGFIFQHSHLLKNLSIRDNIVLPGFKASKFSREQVIQKADQLMKMTGIESVASHDITKVSGGQLQRAAICRALINQPDLLFGDEPTGALNSRTSNEVMDIVQTINSEGTTVMIVTHDAKVAARAGRIIFLLDGVIHDELKLGSYVADEYRISYREKKLSEWLKIQGF